MITPSYAATPFHIDVSDPSAPPPNLVLLDLSGDHTPPSVHP